MTSYLIRDAYLLTMDGDASGTLETGLVGFDRRALVNDVTQAMADLNARVGALLHG